MQAALTMDGLYTGLIDGKWGPLSQGAFEAYAEGPVAFEDAVFLVAAFQEEQARMGWQMRSIPELGVSLALPEAGIVEVENGWRHVSIPLRITLSDRDTAGARAYHAEMRGGIDDPEAAYVLDRPERLVTSYEDEVNFLSYARSDRIGHRWPTVEIFATASGMQLIQTITSSVTVGESPDWALPEEGILAKALEQHLDPSAGSAAVISRAAGPLARPVLMQEDPAF